MILFSLSPLLSAPSTFAQESSNSSATWDKSGSNDTGWVLMQATGADSITGQPAYADLNLDFAPGAEISNLTFEVMVDGGNGISIAEPKLYPVNTADLLFDFSSYGTFGNAGDFDSGNPHSGRMTPNTDTGAVWTLPSGATIDSLVFEALAPIDPVVSFSPYEVDIIDYEFHPTDGRLYLGLENIILHLDANADPHLIDITNSGDVEWGVIDLELDLINDRLIVVTSEVGIMTYSLSDGTDSGMLPSSPFQNDIFTQVIVDGSDTWAASEQGLFKLNSAGTGWTQERVAGSTGWPAGQPIASHLLNSVLYVSIADEGVARWDMANSQPLTTWSSANWLPSDMVTDFVEEGSRILMPTDDAGVARYDYQGQFWLGTWSTSNGLASNEVHGVVNSNNLVYILSGSSLQEYDPALGSMTSPVSISSYGLPRDGLDLLPWPNTGERGPVNPLLMVNDGSGKLIAIDTSSSTQGLTGYNWTSMLLASGPSGFEMHDVIQVGQVAWVTIGENVDRFDLGSYRWLDPIAIGAETTKMAATTSSVWVGTEDSGIMEIDIASATIVNTITTSDGLESDEIAGLAVRTTSTGQIDVVVIHPADGASVIIYQGGTFSVPYTVGQSDGINFMRDVAILGEVAYLATDGAGLMRLNLSSGSLLSPWTSTGVDDVDYASVEMAGSVLLIGLYGHGVVRKDLSTGEYLDTWKFNRQGNGLPSNNVMSLHKDTYGNIWVGTSAGLVQWDGSNFNSPTGGSGWNSPNTFYDLTSDSTTVYAGTNAGMCEYSISSRALGDCYDTQDGMPYNYVRSVAVYGDTVLAGTWLGVGIINTTQNAVIGAWEAGGQTNNAVVEIMDDIAYVALDGIGIARFDLNTGNWLNLWTDGSGGLLDTDGITSMAADRLPNQLWVGGDDGFQLLDVVNETEEYDIEKSSSLFSGNGDPIEIVIAGNVMYYTAPYNNGDNVHRIDLDNMSALTSLDAGTQASLSGNSYVYGLGLINGILNIGVSQWGDDGEGAVVRYDTVNKQWTDTWEATGSVERVTTYESNATGHYWVVWGEVSVNEYDANGQLLNSWDNGIDWPVREIVEYNGELLFATSDGIARYDEANSQWLNTWTPGSGMPNNAEDEVFDLFVDGAELWVGTAGSNWWGNPQNPRISMMASTGSWSTWNGGQNNIPNGFPISFDICNGLVHVAMSNSNNGGIARYDGSSWLSAFTSNSGDLSDDSPDAITCDDTDTLYVGYFDNNVGIDRYDYTNARWLATMDNSNSGISDDGIWWDSIDWYNGQLLLGHKYGTTGSGGNTQVSYGGLSLVAARGGNFGQANIINQGSGVTDIDLTSLGWMVSAAGSSSGYSHIDTINHNGINTIMKLPGLVNGRVVEMIGNSTHVWAVTGNSWAAGQGVLQGLILPNGSVEWEQGWSSYGGDIKEIALVDQTLYVSINGIGLARYDTITGTANVVPAGLNTYTEGLAVWGDDLVVGLQGTWASAAGVQVWNTTLNQWSMGRLLSGLPNNIINDFALTNTHILIATEGGLGMWNISKDDWDDPLTSMDGLASNSISSIDIHQNTAYLGTPVGIARWDLSSQQALSTIKRANGLVGDSTASTVVYANSLNQLTMYAIHDGAGPTRPGVSVLSMNSGSVIETHRPDQIPHNTVTAVATDYWGVHIATVSEPLTHWNATSKQFEDGSAAWQVPSWPIFNMDSDGTDLLVSGTMGGARIDVSSPTHSVLDIYRAEGTSAVCISNQGMWMIAEAGLLGWEPAPAYTQRDMFELRRAEPLNVGFAGIYDNITDSTNPGQMINFLSAGQNVTLDATVGVAGPGGMLMQGTNLVLSSPVDGAATWVKSYGLTYSGTWDLNQTNPNLQDSMQTAVDGGALVDGSRLVQLRLQSPENGSMYVRITYDWVRTETPVEIVDLWDRPDDGGGVLVANWTIVNDDSFSSYILYLNEGPWNSTPTTAADLANLVPDASISVYSRTQTELTTAAGMMLKDGVDYYAIIAVEYAGGIMGTPSAPFGPATSSDEMPMSPAWGNAIPNSGGEIGELYVEWSRCTALDLAMTNIYYSTSIVSDAIALPLHSSVTPEQGNTSIIDLPAGIPYWLALTCVDAAGQENLSDSLIIGPVVPTGGLNDGVPPPKINGVWAEDIDPDEGGRVEVGWEISSADDCAFYTIYVLEVNTNYPVNDNGVPENVDDFIAVEVIADCAANGTIISLYNGIPLTDGQPYWIAVVASDDWLNEDKGNVDIVTATPFRNLFGQNTAPNRIGSIEAWDHPDDDGTAVDVRWTPSSADDFAYYIIWAGEFDMSDVSTAWDSFGPDASSCGCLRVDKQWIIDENTPLEVTINRALYQSTFGGDSPDMGYADTIQPDVEINVTVTVHDINGNVETTELVTASVTPVDNSQDDVAPSRIRNIDVYDFPMDDGTRLLVEFDLSTASDLDYYEVYASTSPFSSVGQSGNGPQNPLLTLSRSHEQPILLEELLFGDPILPNVQITVAVVAYDSSGNVLLDGLLTATGSAVDNGVSDPGANLPDILGVRGEWDDSGEVILVNWVHSTDTRVESYRVWIGDSTFAESGEIIDATLVGIEDNEPSLRISKQAFDKLDNSTSWWIGISASDDLTYRHEITPVEVAKFSASDDGGSGSGGATASDEKGFLGDIAEPTNILIIVLLLAILLVMIMLVRGRDGKGRNAMWELQESTWGISNAGWDSNIDPLAAPAPQSAQPVSSPTQGMAAGLYAAATDIEAKNTPEIPQQRFAQQPTGQQPTIQQPTVQRPASDIDTSFLDDLL